MPRDRDDDRDDDYDRPRRRDRDDDRPRRRSRDRDDDYDRPAARGGNGFAVASLILGIVSVCLGPITGVIGAILGFVGVSKPTGKGMAITGIILNILFSLIGTVGIIFGFMRTGDVAERMKASNNLKQMSFASQNYNDVYSEFPPAYVRRPLDPPGMEPTDLNDRLGWRVTILPYMEQDPLYRQFDLSQPWNGSRNQPLSSTVVKAYADPDTPTDPTTRYRCFYNNGAAFDTRYPVTLNGTS